MVRPANMMGDEDRYLNNFACKKQSLFTPYQFIKSASTDLVRTTRFAPVLRESFETYKEPIYVWALCVDNCH